MEAELAPQELVDREMEEARLMARHADELSIVAPRVYPLAGEEHLPIDASVDFVCEYDGYHATHMVRERERERCTWRGRGMRELSIELGSYVLSSDDCRRACAMEDHPRRLVAPGSGKGKEPIIDISSNED